MTQETYDNRWKALAVLGQRDRQAVQRAHRIQERCQRVGEVVLQVARRAGLDHDEPPPGDQHGVDPLQDRGRGRLVVDGVERGDEDDRDVLAALSLADQARRLKPVHARQNNIQYDQIERRHRSFSQSSFTVVHGDCIVPGLSKCRCNFSS